MLYIFLALVLLLPSIEALIIPKQSPDIGRTVTSRQIPSESVTGSQTQGTLQLQNIPAATFGVVPTNFVQPKKAPVYANLAPVLDPTHTAAQSSQSIGTSPLIKDAPTSSSRSSVSIDRETNSPNVHSQHAHSVQTPAKTSSMTLRPSSTRDTSRLNSQTLRGEAALTYHTRISTSLPAISATPVLKFSQQKITEKSASQYIFPSSQTLSRDSGISGAVIGVQASSGKTTLMNGQSTSVLHAESIVLPALSTDAKNRYILVDGHTLSPGSSTTLGPGTPATILALQTSGTETYLVSSSSFPLLSPVTTTPDLSNIPPLLSISRETVTANILGPYDNNGQTLAPAGAVTVSGTMISLAPGGSDVAVGAGTKALSANNTAGFVSGPNTTGVQSFEGSALGGKDGLWSSSMVVLVGVAVLLWL